jgi:hypothetical protein
MRFGIDDMAGVDEIRFFSQSERLGYASVPFTDRTSCPANVPEGRVSDTARGVGWILARGGVRWIILGRRVLTTA